MKKQTKNRLFKLLGIGACSFVLGLSACSSNYYYGDHRDETKQYDYVEKHARKNIAYDSSSYTISYDSTDLSNFDYWYNVYSVLSENGYDLNNYLSLTGLINDSIQLNRCFLTANGNNTYLTLNFSYGSGTTYFCGISLTDNSVTWSVAGAPITYSTLSITSEEYYGYFAVDEPSDNMPQVLTDFMSLLVGGIQSLAVGIANGVASMASALFLNVENGAVTGLSTFGGIIAIFAGIALAVGITTRVYLWITRLGKD